MTKMFELVVHYMFSVEQSTLIAFHNKLDVKMNYISSVRGIKLLWDFFLPF